MRISSPGMIASVGCIILSMILLFGNPYSGTRAGTDTIVFISIMVILPACLGVTASLFRLRVLMIIVFIWSLPYGLYLTVAAVPSLFNLFGAVLLFYLVSALTMKKSRVD